MSEELSMLNDLWMVIGINGCQLNEKEKVIFVGALSAIAGWPDPFRSLWNVFRVMQQEGTLPDFPNTTPPLNAQTFEKVFTPIRLSSFDCWRAIEMIAGAQTSQMLWASIAAKK